MQACTPKRPGLVSVFLLHCILALSQVFKNYEHGKDDKMHKVWLIKEGPVPPLKKGGISRVKSPLSAILFIMFQSMPNSTKKRFGFLFAFFKQQVMIST